jgi:hypothetical protein
LASKSIGDYILPGSLFKFKVLKGTQLQNIQSLGRIYFVYLLLYSGFEFTISFLTHSRFNYTSADQGKMYFGVGVLMTSIQGLFIFNYIMVPMLLCLGVIVRKIPAQKQRYGALFGLAIIVPSYLLMSVAFSTSILYSSLALYAISSSMVVPCLTTLVSNECSDNEKGVGMGVLRSLGALSRSVGLLILSVIKLIKSRECKLRAKEKLTCTCPNSKKLSWFLRSIEEVM